jgi:hypothetical protein
METIALLIVVPALAYFLVKWLFTKDTEIENRRRRSAELAGKFTAYGLKDAPKLLNDYAVGDYSGLVHDFRVMLDKYLSGDDAAIERELDSVFESVLSVKLSTADGRTVLAAKLAEFTPPTIAA